MEYRLAFVNVCARYAARDRRSMEGFNERRSRCYIQIYNIFLFHFALSFSLSQTLERCPFYVRIVRSCWLPHCLLFFSLRVPSRFVLKRNREISRSANDRRAFRSVSLLPTRVYVVPMLFSLRPKEGILEKKNISYVTST